MNRVGSYASGCRLGLSFLLTPTQSCPIREPQTTSLSPGRNFMSIGKTISWVGWLSHGILLETHWHQLSADEDSWLCGGENGHGFSISLPLINTRILPSVYALTLTWWRVGPYTLFINILSPLETESQFSPSTPTQIFPCHLDEGVTKP